MNTPLVSPRYTRDHEFKAIHPLHEPWIQKIANVLSRRDTDLRDDLVQSGTFALLTMCRTLGHTVLAQDIRYIQQAIRNGMLGELRAMRRARRVLRLPQEIVRSAKAGEHTAPVQQKRHTIKFRMHPTHAPRHRNCRMKHPDEEGTGRGCCPAYQADDIEHQADNAGYQAEKKPDQTEE